MNQPATPASSVTDDDKLDLLDQVISDVSNSTSPVPQSLAATNFSHTPQASAQTSTSQSASVVDQVLPAVALQATDTLNPAQPVKTGQERIDGGTSVDTSVVEAGSIGQVESEKVPELPVEVEGYLQHVADHQDQLPQEVVVSGDDITLQPSHRPNTPVVVLPITQDDEQKARFKNTSYSIRWLIEWSHKLIKQFAGKIIYRIEKK